MSRLHRCRNHGAHHSRGLQINRAKMSWAKIESRRKSHEAWSIGESSIAATLFSVSQYSSHSCSRSSPPPARRTRSSTPPRQQLDDVQQLSPDQEQGDEHSSGDDLTPPPLQTPQQRAGPTESTNRDGQLSEPPSLERR